ncbi:MAG: methylmalonyl Co-A mutase-associated GTPase MeaB [Acidobacteria bacterium]|nr:methylmalonyl Co-A mutase-associated GTPase MeaB [Acidobacteriota bacterium]MCB9399202.1 methylmalonyl Co-A mutase-associated GTPase MeaB [Acidobacteriota bacterium]
MNEAEWLEAIQAGNRRALARAITLIESTRPDQRHQAVNLVAQARRMATSGIRIGISGVPGVGKSTFIERFGLLLIEKGHKVAVLAVDPSSRISGGSILGDKVRMPDLSAHANAFIRPSPSAGSLGGVARRTHENAALLHAAGYDVVLIETVGVGQSEIEVAKMVDFFLVLMLPNAGDEMQGIKRGILEMADCLVVNKIDQPDAAAVNRALNDYRSALSLMRPRFQGWQVPVLPASGLQGTGLEEVWSTIQKHRDLLQKSGLWQQQRSDQAAYWFGQDWATALLEALQAHPEYGDFQQQAFAAMQNGGSFSDWIEAFLGHFCQTDHRAKS